jgi:ferredoxin
MTGWPLAIDRDLCMGSGVCVVYAPGTFAHDDEAKAILLDPSTDDLEAVRTAVEVCPTSALRLLTNDEGT